MFQLRQVKEFTEQVVSVVAQCVYNPTEEKMNGIIQLYKSDANRVLYAYDDGSRIAAIIGLLIKPEEIVILHIAVDQGMRGKGFGRALLDEVMSLYELTTLKTETDKDAVGFYRTCGFRIESLGELYPGVERFLCTKLRLDSIQCTEVISSE
ncbi:GNAT family N-acetyltransferase [Paenibacillus lupini]|uniref:GNAT family N-acetyltransferase n=1 Tax=Paenibacillus lupini TaxID=1450204 RepID=UPI0031333E72|nr:ribosomal protein S18 acetylase RimI-like enzyme [Paenibacillus lupini]